MDQQVNKEYNLKPYAALPKDGKNITKCINKIMNTLSFRKLAGKTQVILSLSGPDIRTRLTHTIEVARIARDICIELGLNADLAEAIALAHDIGHTPFGHVGERTLREIMCGCDTLGGKVADHDFANSGFKHNLQSFRVLYNFEKVTNDYKEIWPYILWGAVAHSKPSWAKPESGMEEEILISSKHCDWVHVCHYHEEKECKRNIQDKKPIAEKTGKEICKPWFCAGLEVVKTETELKEEDLKLEPGETTRDYLAKEYIKKKYREYVYCSQRCYLAKLWKYRIKEKHISLDHPYLFDHPFPNSFYSKSLHEYLYSNIELNEYFSVEAVIVSQADEIAQRQQDLEDGINKGLLTFQEARVLVIEMVDQFKDENHISYLKIEETTKSDELGKLLVEFYSNLIVFGTKQNFAKFENDAQKININIFSLLNIFYSMCPDKNRKPVWIIRELKTAQDGSSSMSDINDSLLFNYFEINYCRAYLYLLSYDYLEDCARKGEHSNEFIDDILDQFVKCMELDINAKNHKNQEHNEKRQQDFNTIKEAVGTLIKDRTNSNPTKIFLDFLIILDKLRDYLKKFYEHEFADYSMKKKNGWWKNIGDLNLHHFSVLHWIYEKHFTNSSDIFCAKDLTKAKIAINSYKYEHQVVLEQWKKRLRSEANRVFSHLVDFMPEDDTSKKKKVLKDFEENQKNTILKSEAVEKNDGKSSYILTRLFKAYITNSHQLPDAGLKYIIIALQDKAIWKKLKEDEDKTFQQILMKLEKTMIDGKAKSKEITDTNFIEVVSPQLDSDDVNFEKLKRGTSNEVKAALDNRRKLYKFFYYIEQDEDKISKGLNSEKDEDRTNLKDILRKFRAILDNPFLNATPLWKSILTRGICDYIAGLTDQEALNEYEKLYAGIMELI